MRRDIALTFLAAALLCFAGSWYYVHHPLGRWTVRCVASHAMPDADIPPNFAPWCDSVATFNRFGVEVGTRTTWEHAYDSLRQVKR